jgi:mycothiol synthase
VAPVSTGVPDAATRAELRQLIAEIEIEDGAPPLSDQVLSNLDSSEVRHLVAREADSVTGYAQRDGDDVEVAARAETIGQLLEELTEPGLRIWTHGRHSRLIDAVRERGFRPIRELYQLRRSLSDLPADPPLPDGVEVRSFRPGEDDAEWLAVNAAAFATHAEQGRWTQRDLAARMAEPWFDPAGFLIADGGGELLGYHWTKIHPDGVGEVYVLGVAPAAQGLRLGPALLARGLRHLAGQGCPEVLLYVDGDNTGARRLYHRAGFHEHDLDVQWQLPTS